MKRWAVVKNDEPLELIESADPVPKGAEVMLEVMHCGVCHSDLHFVHGSFDLGGGQVLKITDRGVKLPCAPGHEIVGRVVALGPAATGVRIGDERVVYPWIGCGKCELCLSDRENLCYQSNSLGVIRDGGFGSHVVLPNSSYLFDYGSVDPALASTFACSGLTVYSAIRKLMPIDLKCPVLIIGAGGLGSVAISMLRALEHDNILVVDPSAEKRKAALEAGATQALDNSSGLTADQITEAAGGWVFYALDFVNKKETITLAMNCLGKGGKLLMVGVGGGEYPLSLAGMIFRPRSIMGTITGSRQDLREVIALAQSGKLAPLPVTRMPKDDANKALRLLATGQVVGRIVLGSVNG
jgi:alcohol dehydrogenase/propanol-preferring alcohol dehydrogenase